MAIIWDDGRDGVISAGLAPDDWPMKVMDMAHMETILASTPMCCRSIARTSSARLSNRMRP